MDKRTPSLRGEVVGADTTGPAVARVGTRGVIEAVDSFMARWHRNKEERSCSRHATGDAESGRMGKGGGALIPLSTKSEANGQIACSDSSPTNKRPCPEL